MPSIDSCLCSRQLDEMNKILDCGLPEKYIWACQSIAVRLQYMSIRHLGLLTAVSAFSTKYPVRIFCYRSISLPLVLVQ
jgi:hypothetical protein